MSVMPGITRRQFIALGSALPAVAGLSCQDDDPGDGWDQGSLAHLLPTASHRAFNIKASFRVPPREPPALLVDERRVRGEQTDSAGRFFAFRVAGLEPDHEYRMRLVRAESDHALCESWPLRTLPAPEAQPKRLRVGSFTCAGGANIPTPPSLFHAFKPARYRRRLFDLLLAESPDLVVANGDHVYYDLPAMGAIQNHPLAPLFGPFAEGVMARFDPGLPVMGGSNQDSLMSVGDDQIASIYGVRFRSTPVFFVTDDHDYFDNDDATPERVTLPPDPFHRTLRNQLQRLYFPEFIAEDENATQRPDFLLGQAEGVSLSTHFGRVRYGDLFSGLFYDCGGYLSLEREGGLVPASVERWLLAETAREDTLHLAHFPSHPPGFTAGKWREWYRDLIESSGSVVAAIERDEKGDKFMWQKGWWEQHQRLLAGLSAQERRRALVVSGDLHALGAVQIEASGSLHLGANPVHSILSGPVGVGDLGWPSRARGVTPRIPLELAVESLLDLDERTGFTLLDFDRGGSRIETFGGTHEYVSAEALRVQSALALELPLT